MQLVWDIPTRLFHWVLTMLIVFSWWTVHHHHIDWHIWSGTAILTLLIFRILWGFVGSSTARFSNFVRGPRHVRAYLSGGWRGVGHSPLGAISVIALLSALFVQVGLGLVAQDQDGIYMGPLARLVTSDHSDQARGLHAAWFNVIIALVVVHLAAIIYYQARGKPLTRSMLIGTALVEGPIKPVRLGSWWVALLCLGAGIAITRWVVAGAPY